MNEDKFFEGDHVEWLGIKGVVADIRNVMSYPVVIKFDGNDGLFYFYKDGSFLCGQAPSLKKVEMIKVERWVNIYPGHITEGYYRSKEDADNGSIPNRIACVKLTGEYERP